jgi:hypothetical protein
MLMHYFLCSGGTNTDSIKSVGIRYTELAFLHPVGSVEHVVHFGKSRAHNVVAIFVVLAWNGMGSTKTELGHVTLNLCFCIRLDLRVM